MYIIFQNVELISHRKNSACKLCEKPSLKNDPYLFPRSDAIDFSVFYRLAGVFYYKATSTRVF